MNYLLYVKKYRAENKIEYCLKRAPIFHTLSLFCYCLQPYLYGPCNLNYYACDFHRECLHINLRFCTLDAVFYIGEHFVSC